MPYTTLTGRLMQRNYLDMISVRIRDGYNTKNAEEQLVRLMTLRHGKKIPSPTTSTAL